MKLSLPEIRTKLETKVYKDLYMLTFIDLDGAWKIEMNHASELRYNEPKLFHHISSCEDYAITSRYKEYNVVRLVNKL